MTDPSVAQPLKLKSAEGARRRREAARERREGGDSRMG
jgi:hypothetical protein